MCLEDDHYFLNLCHDVTVLLVVKSVDFTGVRVKVIEKRRGVAVV